MFEGVDPTVSHIDIRRPITLSPPPEPRPGELQLTDDFWPLLTQLGRYKVYFGGRGAGKSQSIAKALIWIAARTKVRILCTREIQHTIKESVHASLKRCIEEMGYGAFFTVTHEGIRSTAGAEFIFMGLRSHSNEIKSLHDIGICWVEEAQAVTEESWTNLTNTIRKIKATDAETQIWVSFNPFKEDQHTYKLFVKGKESIERNFPGSYVKLVNWDRNPWFVNCGLELERQAAIARIDEAVDEAGKAEAYLKVLHVWEGHVKSLPSGNFFSLTAMLKDGKPVPLPLHPTYVFVTMDTSMKTGQERDGCGIVYWAVDVYDACEFPLYILDWDYKQIDGAFLEDYMATVYATLEHYAEATKALQGSKGAHIEDASSGIILLQQCARNGWEARAIQSKLMRMGKSERCFNVSSYVHLGQVKCTEAAFNKRVTYKGETKNHMMDQVLGFKADVKEDPKAQDDVRDAWAYGIATALGSPEEAE